MGKLGKLKIKKELLKELKNNVNLKEILTLEKLFNSKDSNKKNNLIFVIFKLANQDTLLVNIVLFVGIYQDQVVLDVDKESVN
jgi:hypothetical protein